MMRWTSTGGFPPPSYLLLAVVILTLLLAREALFFLRLVMPCMTGVAPLQSFNRGFGTSLLPHGLMPRLLVGLGWFYLLFAVLPPWVFSTP